MSYEEYIAYHKRGDAGVEERMIASIIKHLAFFIVKYILIISRKIVN